jgi:hypothetical protein
MTIEIETHASEAKAQEAAPDPGAFPAGPAVIGVPWAEFALLLGEAYRHAPLFA